MRGTRLILVSAVLVSLGMSAASAAAYVDSGTDPEGDSTDDRYDISFSTRSVVEGRRRVNLRIGIRTYDSDFQLNSWVDVLVKLMPEGAGRPAQSSASGSGT